MFFFCFCMERVIQLRQKQYFEPISLVYQEKESTIQKINQRYQNENTKKEQKVYRTSYIKYEIAFSRL